MVLLRSGWDRLYRTGPGGNGYGWDVVITKSVPGWPAPDEEMVSALHEKGVQCLGADGLSVGPADDGLPAHVAGLSRSTVFVEALTNLSALPPRGAFFLTLFLKIEEGTGGPGRAIAVLPK